MPRVLARKDNEKKEKIRKKRAKMRRMSRLMSTQQGEESESRENERTLIDETISDSNLTLIADSSKSQSQSQSQSQVQKTPRKQAQTTQMVPEDTRHRTVADKHTISSILIETRNRSNTTEKRKRKTVRFDEKTVLINDANVIDEANLKPEKSHLTISTFSFLFS